MNSINNDKMYERQYLFRYLSLVHIITELNHQQQTKNMQEHNRYQNLYNLVFSRSISFT